MKTREKAIELYNKFRNENSVTTANFRAKRQANLCIDEILEATKGMIDEVFEEGVISSNEYWIKVKEELNNL